MEDAGILLFVVLWIEPRILCTLGRHSAIEAHTDFSPGLRVNKGLYQERKANHTEVQAGSMQCHLCGHCRLGSWNFIANPLLMIETYH